LNPDWPARYAGEAWSNGQIIAVGAVDSSNVIAGFSNRAGDTRNSFLVAPGTNVVGASAFSNTGLAAGSGTSVAAPFVSGIAAMVRVYWPHLSATQVANVLLSTATDLGDPGTDDVYGRGLVNATAALAPVGTMMVPLASGRAVPLASISFNPGPVAGQAVRAAALEGRLVGVSLDQFGRQFAYDLAGGLARAPNLTLDRVLGSTDRHFGFTEHAFGNGGRLLMATDSLGHQAVGGLAEYEQRERSSNALGGLAFTLPLAADREVAAGSMGLASTYFGFAGMGEHAASLALPALANPLFAFAPAHNHLGFGQSFGGGLKVKAGLVSTTGTTPLLTQFGLFERPATRANAFVLEASKRFDGGYLALTGTQLDEQGSYLGSTASEAFAFGRRPATTSLTLSAAYALGERWVVAGQYTAAATPGYSNDAGSLVAGVRSSRANAFGFALVKTGMFVERDRLSLSISQPLRAASGAMDFVLPVDVNAEGAVQYLNESVALKPNGRERITELHYTHPLSKRASLALAAVHRLQPNHDAGAPAEKVIALRWSLGF
jgi:Subtilase family